MSKYRYLIKGYWEKREEGEPTVRKLCLADLGCLVYVRNWRLVILGSRWKWDYYKCHPVPYKELCQTAQRSFSFLTLSTHHNNASGQMLLPPVSQIGKLETGNVSNLFKNRWLAWLKRSQTQSHTIYSSFFDFRQGAFLEPLLLKWLICAPSPLCLCTSGMRWADETASVLRPLVFWLAPPSLSME